MLRTAAILSVLMTGCGGSEDDTTGQRPSDETLCMMKVGVTTKTQAIELLGMPTSSADSENLSRLVYQYLVVSGGQVKTNEAISLWFDAQAVLESVDTLNRPLPSCFKTDAGT
jgi:outer membrane protein assembly factor BamE (lipoprotein component of BamABCDE complex)